MARVRRTHVQVYIGLFLIAFVLFAQERKLRLSLPTVQLPAEVDLPRPTPFSSLRTRKLEELAELFQRDALFGSGTDGLKLVVQLDRVSLVYQGEEVFGPGDFAVRETWYTSLDRFASIIRPYLDRGLRLEILGYTDANSTLDKMTTELGSSSYALAFTRAEWVARFLERRSQLDLQGLVRLTGMGQSPQGRRVEITLQFVE